MIKYSIKYYFDSSFMGLIHKLNKKLIGCNQVFSVCYSGYISCSLGIIRYTFRKKFALILTTTDATTTVLDGDPNLDITADIIEGLNNEYVKDKKNASATEEKPAETPAEAPKAEKAK